MTTQLENAATFKSGIVAGIAAQSNYAGSGTVTVQVGTVTSQLAGCGDGVVDAQETCDDGNSVSGDGCSALCRAEAGYDCTKYAGKMCFKVKSGGLSVEAIAGIIGGVVLLVVAGVLAVFAIRSHYTKKTFAVVEVKPQSV